LKYRAHNTPNDYHVSHYGHQHESKRNWDRYLSRQSPNTRSKRTARRSSHTRYAHHHGITRGGSFRHQRHRRRWRLHVTSRTRGVTDCHRRPWQPATLVATIHSTPETISSPHRPRARVALSRAALIDPDHADDFPYNTLLPVVGSTGSPSRCRFTSRTSTIVKRAESMHESSLDADVATMRELARDDPAFPGSPHVLILIAVLTIDDDHPRRIRGTRGIGPPTRWTRRARRAPRCHWMLPANFRARTSVPRSTPTVLSTPVLLPPGRLGCYSPRGAYTSRLTLSCADTRASCKLDNLRASSRASVERRGWTHYGGSRMTRRQFGKEENAFSPSIPAPARHALAGLQSITDASVNQQW